MSDYVYDGTSLPSGKVDARPPPNPTNQYISAAEWNTVVQAVDDLRAAVLSGDYHGLANFPTAAGSAAGASRVRMNGDTIEASVSGDQYRRIFEPKRFNVRDFGAKGDNSTDDAAAISSAIAAAGAAGGGVVYFPPGTYYVASTVYVDYDNVCLLGEGFFGNPKITNKDGSYTTLQVRGATASSYRRRVRIARLNIYGQLFAYNCIDLGLFEVFVSYGHTHTLLIEGGWGFNISHSQFQSAKNGHDVFFTSDAASSPREVNAIDFVACRIEGASQSGIASDSSTQIQNLTLHGGIIETHTSSTAGFGVDIPYGNNINGIGVYFEGNAAGNVRLGSASTAVSGGSWVGINNAGFGDPNPRPPVGFDLVNASGIEVSGRHTGFAGEWLRAEPACSGIRASGAEVIETFANGSAPATILGSGAKSSIAGVNIARNGGFRNWSGSTPIGFYANVGSETFAQSTSPVNTGPYALSVTNAASSSGGATQRWQHPGLIGRLTSRKITVSVLAYSTDANRARIRLGDGTTTVLSNTHPGDGKWHCLSATITVAAGASYVLAVLEITSGTSVTVYFDDLSAVVDADGSFSRGPAFLDMLATMSGTVTTSGAGPTYQATVSHYLDMGTAYQVQLTPGMNAKAWVTSKAAGQFTVNTDAAGSVDYLIIPA